MGREPAARWLRRVAWAASWVVAASIAQGLLEPDIGHAAKRVVQTIEEQLERRGAPAQQKQPERSREVDSLEPWELVGV
jgi:hypothetical protein